MDEYKKVGYLLYKTGKIYSPGTRVFGEDEEIFSRARELEVDAVRIGVSRNGKRESDRFYLPRNGEYVESPENHPLYDLRPRNNQRLS